MMPFSQQRPLQGLRGKSRDCFGKKPERFPGFQCASPSSAFSPAGRVFWVLCFPLPAAGCRVAAHGGGKGAQGESPGSGQGPGPASACLGPSLREGACRRAGGCASLWAWASFGGWWRGAFSEPVTSLLEHTQRGVSQPGFCVTKAFQQVR